jgi:hypothetical protein
MAVEGIWEIVMTAMPQQLIERWSQGGISLRALLCETVHQSCYRWQKEKDYVPGIQGLASPVPGDDEALLQEQRRDILDRARDRLKGFKSDNEDDINYLYHAFLGRVRIPLQMIDLSAYPDLESQPPSLITRYVARGGPWTISPDSAA